MNPIIPTRRAALGYLAAALFALLWVPHRAAAQAPAEASRVRILLVCDMAGDSKERQRRTVNRNEMELVLEELLRKQGLGKRYTLDILAGPKVTRDAVLNYYARLKTGPTEALFMYCNTHGKTDPRRGHYLVLGGKRLYRSELRKAMARGKPRLIVLLTDACATLPGTTPAKKKTTAAARKSGSGKEAGRQASGRQQGLVLRHLLFRHQGVVDINAARKGSFAWGNVKNGNCFTDAFTQLLSQPVSRFDRNRNGLVEWDEFYRVLAAETRRQAAKRGRSQMPQAFSLAKKPGKKAAD
jgi:hypothetical protein